MTRYSMLGSMREYGRERLDACGELGAVRDRHLDWLAPILEAGSAQLQISKAEALRRVDRELPNIRAALDWASGDATRAARGVLLVLALGRYWYQRGITA